MPPKKALRYQVKKDLREHVLARPGMYCGDMELGIHDEYIVKAINGVDKIVKERIEYIPGFLRGFIEVLSNAQDNVWRTAEHREATGDEVECTKIELTIDEKTGETSMWNDGMTIPVKKGEEEGTTAFYIPEFVFGIYMSSSNYDDEEDRKTSGTNGYGAKLTNTFSQWFKVETYDKERGLFYSQKWENNMSTVHPATIKSVKKEKGYTKISWVPDFKRFGLAGYNNTYISLIKRYMYECAMMFKVPTYINGKKIPVNCLKTTP